MVQDCSQPAAASRARELIEELKLRLKHTFAGSLVYAGTTTRLDSSFDPQQDIDLILVFDLLSSSHLFYCHTVIDFLIHKYKLILDTRIYERRQIAEGNNDFIGLHNKSLLSGALIDLVGDNPFKELKADSEAVADSCRLAIEEQLAKIVEILPSIPGNTQKLRDVGQIVFDAVRAYLILSGNPRCDKAEANREFQKDNLGFPELNELLQAHRDPAQVFRPSDLLLEAHGVVLHLKYKAQPRLLDKRIVLVNTQSAWLPHPRGDNLRSDSNMPLGLLCVGSYAQAKGLDVSLLDAYAENLDAFSVVDRLFAGSSSPSVVAFNCSSPNVDVVQKIARYIKRIDPRVSTVAGGPHPTLAPAKMLAPGHIDFVVVGEGEETFRQLAEALVSEMGRQPDVDGVYYLGEQKQLMGRTRTERLDLATLPNPDFALLPLPRYFSVRKRLYLHSARGCFHDCVFCSVPKCWPGGVTEVPITKLVDQIADSIRKYEPDEFQIVDDNFSSRSGRRIREFCSELVARGLSIEFKCQARADQLGEELICQMKACGCFEIDLGIESGSPRIQSEIRKRLKLHKVLEVVARIASAGIVCKAFFMLGFPDESYVELQETINYSIALKENGLSDVAFFPVMPFPGTRLANSTGIEVLQGAVVDPSSVFDSSFAGSRMRKYSAKPEVSLNSLFVPDDLRLLVRFAYERFSRQAPVSDLEKEFAEYREVEEGVIFGV